MGVGGGEIMAGRGWWWQNLLLVAKESKKSNILSLSYLMNFSIGRRLIIIL